LTAVALANSSHARDAWNDRILETFERWRWPLPVTFAVLAFLAVLLLHAVEWFLGPLPPGEIDPFIVTLPAYPLGVLGLMAVQNRVSVAALARFRPATDLDDEAYRAVAHALTHQPALGALISGVVMATMGVVIEVSKDGAVERFERYPAAFAFYLAGSALFYAPAGPWFLRTIRLLRRVHVLHREARHVDLLNPAPVHAFSAVTALVGLSFIAITTLSVATDPATHQTAGGAVLTVGLLAMAVACFVLPSGVCTGGCRRSSRA
jgi:hypothetical protein